MLKGEHSDGNNVIVELYDCNPLEMYNLDILEGHPRFYKRKKVDISVGENTYSAWVYFVPDNHNYNNGSYVESYKGQSSYIQEQIQNQY
jgi:gamma-glutamylcyclotransferase (GGCT)/AIG2-like uncharacterized protein YtfP